MIARITPSALAGTVTAISSKSMAHRLIIAAALANGETQVRCNTTCADIDATVRCLTALGATITRSAGVYTIHPIPKSQEHGILRALAGAVLDCGESGSTLRFMLPVACALGADATFTGEGRLKDRPLSPLTDELVAAGCDMPLEGGLPLTATGRLRPGVFELPGDVSSQYISGLLLACPLLGRPSEIRVHGTIESKPYIDLTIQALAAFGVIVHSERDRANDLTVFHIEGTGYRTPGAITVEGDWSNAAFWLCAGAMGSNPITVDGLSMTSAQGDRNILAALSLFGARIGRTDGTATVRPDRLRGYETSARDIPDLVPIISAVASVAEGTTRIRDCARLRLKESDRLETCASELSKLGAHIRIEGDDLVIEGVASLAGGTVDAHNDHRIAMMAAIAATRCTEPVIIHGADAVNKSYPDFFSHYRQLGGTVSLEEGR